jgi:hypothetical protein
VNVPAVFAIALCTLPSSTAFAAQAKPAGQGDVVAASGQTEGRYRVFAYQKSPVPRFRYRIEIDLADGRALRALPHFQNQHTDFDEPFEKAPVEMAVQSGGQLLVFGPFTGMPGEVIEVTYLARPASPTYLYLVNSRLSGLLSRERWYAVRGWAPASTLHLKPNGRAISGQLLDPSSVAVADLAGVFHGSVLIGTITPRGRSEPGGRFRWTFLDRGRQFDGDSWSGEERQYVAGEWIRKP